MFVEHLQLFKVKVALLELFPLLSILYNQTLALLLHLLISKAPLLYVDHLPSDDCLLLAQLPGHILFVFGSFLFTLSCHFRLLVVFLAHFDGCFTLLLFVLLHCFLALVDLAQQFCLFFNFGTLLVLLMLSFLVPDSLVILANLLTKASLVQLGFLAVGPHFELDSFKRANCLQPTIAVLDQEGRILLVSLVVLRFQISSYHFTSGLNRLGF